MTDHPLPRVRAPLFRASLMSLANFGSLPNIISIGRLFLVPVMVSMIASNRWTGAFLVFLIAGISDAVDGWLAKTFDLRTELGAILDPLADKALLVSVYIALAIVGEIPATLAILVVSRDVMIVGAVMISWLLAMPVEIRPLLVSKANTAAQISFAALVLGAKGFGFALDPWIDVAVYAVAALTLVSAGAYLSLWIKHMDL